VAISAVRVAAAAVGHAGFAPGEEPAAPSVESGDLPHGAAALAGEEWSWRNINTPKTDVVVTDGGKVLHQVTLQHIGVSSRPGLALVYGLVRPFAHAAGIAMVDEASLPDGFDDLAAALISLRFGSRT